jgi:hypothetical protein
MVSYIGDCPGFRPDSVPDSAISTTSVFGFASAPLRVVIIVVNSFRPTLYTGRLANANWGAMWDVSVINVSCKRYK